MIGATLIFGSLGLSGNVYCAKRSYFQNYYSKTVKTYWMGFAKYWWMFLITASAAVLIGCALGTSVIYLLQQQTLGTAGAGAYCAVVFSWIFGAPLVLIPITMLPLYVTYELTFVQAFKNAIVLIVNNPITICLVGIASVVPFVIMAVAGSIFGIIVFVVMVLAGCNLFALVWVASAHRGMTKCHLRKEESDKAEVQRQRQIARKNTKQSSYVGAGGGSAQKKNKNKQQAKPYQNPKKKKKK